MTEQPEDATPAPEWAAALAMLAATAEAGVLAALATVPPALLVPAVLAVLLPVATAGAQVGSLAATARLEAVTGHAMPPVAVTAPAGLDDRLSAAVATILDQPDNAPGQGDDAMDNVAARYLAEAERVGGAQARAYRRHQAHMRRVGHDVPFDAAVYGATRAIGARGPGRWTRVPTGEECPRCTRFVREGPTGIPPTSMWRHPNCRCLPIPVA